MSKNKYIIDIIGTQCIEDEIQDSVTVTTTGDYRVASTGNKFIRYKEYDEENPSVFKNTIIKISDRQLTITRSGEYASQLILECNKRHQCHYHTPVGSLIIGVFTKVMDISLNEQGGSIDVAYTLDFDSETVSENTFKINIREN